MPPDFPEELGHLWVWFIDLFKPDNGITYTEIKAWSELTGNEPNPYEIEVLKKLEQLYYKVTNGWSWEY